jgi:hypothetical protein
MDSYGGRPPDPAGLGSARPDRHRYQGGVASIGTLIGASAGVVPENTIREVIT